MHTNPIHYIPIATTLFSLYFFTVLYRHWLKKKDALYIFWWMVGVLFYAAGTITESVNTLFGYSDLNFRLWYIFGALLGGAPLAQGTIYLLMKRSVANVLTVLLVIAIIVSSVLVMLTPLHPELIVNHRMSGKIIEWHYIVYIVPFINTYAFLFFVGGAVYSAIKYARNKIYKKRFLGNLLIALGGLLPGIGGTYTRYGHVEVLYITEFLGIILIYSGYNVIRNDRTLSVHSNQKQQ